jgi:hypothetical protein
MVDATMPVATTSKIVPLIMNELLIFRLHFARVESGQCDTNWAKATIARRTQAAKKTRRPVCSASCSSARSAPSCRRPAGGRQRKADPDLRRQRRLLPAVERRHLDLAAIGAVASGLSAPAAAKSMHWSSSWSPMTRLLGSARRWGRTVNGSY